MRSSTFAVLVPMLLLSACMGSGGQTKQQQLEDYTKITGGTYTDPVHGKQIGFWYGSIDGANGVSANGVGFIRLLQDGASIVTMNLNILPAEKGSHYQAFLTDGSGASVDVGALTSIIGDARHTARLETEQDVSGLQMVEIRLLRDGGGSPTVVATGTLKQPTAT